MPSIRTEVVYNACFGGFSLSSKAEAALKKLDPVFWTDQRIGLLDLYRNTASLRSHPQLVQVVRELGDEANGECAELRISSIEGSRYIIDEYDGSETVNDERDIENQWATAWCPYDEID